MFSFMCFFRIIVCLCGVVSSFFLFLCVLSVVCFRGSIFHDVLYNLVSDRDPDVFVVAHIYRACVGHLYCACAVSFAYTIMLYAW